MKILLGLTIIFCSNLFAQTWEEQAVPSGITRLLSISAVGNSAWISGANGDLGNGRVIRTTNGGQNWQHVNTGLPSTNFPTYYIFAVDENTALVTSTSGALSSVYRTSNGGASWSMVLFQINGYINAVWIKPDGNGFMQGDAVGNRWSFWRTTNYGATWDSSGLFFQTSGTTWGSTNMFVVENRIWFVSRINGSNYLMHSTNFGNTWMQQFCEAYPSGWGYSIWFDPHGTGLGYVGSCWKTTNFGTNWTDITGFCNGITSPDFGNTIWKCDNGQTLSTGSGNGTWTTMYQTPSLGLNQITVDRGSIPSHGYAIRGQGSGGAGISHISLPLVGINNINSEIPKEFSLSQNYPNPFNPKSKIKMQIAKLSAVKLIVFDELGREVQTLVNEQLNAGSYEVDFDGSNLSSGVYFYKIIAGDFVETRKIVLIK